MTRTQLQRRVAQRETLQKMHEAAQQDGDDARDARIVAGILETDELIERLKSEAERPDTGDQRRRRR